VSVFVLFSGGGCQKKANSFGENNITHFPPVPGFSQERIEKNWDNGVFLL
jgi:hypothetical protein